MMVILEQIVPLRLKIGRIRGTLGSRSAFDKRKTPPRETLTGIAIRLSFQQTSPMSYPPLPPMDQGEYRAMVRSVICIFIGALIFAGIGFYLSLKNFFPLDALSTALLGFLLFFCVGPKFFPDSTKFISRRARDYRRSRKGLDPLDPEDEPKPEIIRDFQRKP